ncbi:hypothetical protein GCM10007036_14070 [Alsobacter metallidurans]|uniref:Uncharacterized protein n=1 Tax=Alsobacter metallidurans TaxID=340221 RepID=A0A917I664_9HYPH|nr:hypothetical protein [Alsobacter metallidurans]GGH14625.1 hypothetical protein GCM10007036_14070 [Alsobacter metallidurans]
MPQFTVYLQQYVEMVAKTLVEGEDAEQARDKALDRVRQAPAGGIEWGEGDDA